MCFNKEASLMSFIFSLSIVIKLYINNYKFEAVYLSAIGLMQIVEFFLWTYLKNKKTNQFITNFVTPFALFMQPILVIYAYSLVTDINLYFWLIYFLVMYACFFGYLIINYDKNAVTTVSDKTCRLKWNAFSKYNCNFFQGTYWYMYSFIALYALYMTDNIELFITWLVTLLFSFIYMKYYGVYDFSVQTAGSFYCFLVNLSSIAAVFFVLKVCEPEPESSNEKNWWIIDGWL